MNREDLFRQEFERKELVCSHIHSAKEMGSLDGKEAFPLCVQIYEDGFNLFWYCEKCVEMYGLSRQGTYVYDAEDEFFERLEDLDDFKAGENLDLNPFSDYLEEQKGFMLSKHDFSKLSVTFDTEKPISEANIMRVPFGAKLKR
ncbi:hypothetical protein ONV78_31625 [Hahella sp. CR1]|uniref:hypothetical protein n=1 Tax=Hahella sp. CR1 TaxID=2992807 RepID=UPI0024434170|nr:hypothetical protein [Hahella sp. CR1]MDG9672324.1 hypothetical protein [Hahella sp. CR1]